MSISQEYSDDPSSSTTPQSSPLEVEQVDGLVVGEIPVYSSLRSKICRSRNYNLGLVFFMVLAFIVIGSDIFESRDLTLPLVIDDSNATNPWNAMDNDNGENEKKEGEEVIDDDDDDGADQNNNEETNNNVVDLDAKNPKRDGVEFISPTCNYTCMTDRLPHESPLYPGQVLCNEMHRFGMTQDGEFFLQDCQLNTTKVIWSAKDAQLTPDQYPIHFELQKNGHFQIISDPTGHILLEDGPKRNVTYHYMCLHNKPKLDCPYLHLHPDGVLVLNWIDDHKWMVRDVKQQYKGLFPDQD